MVVFSRRTQTLSAVFQGLLDGAISVDLVTGAVTIDEALLLPEEVEPEEVESDEPSAPAPAESVDERVRLLMEPDPFEEPGDGVFRVSADLRQVLDQLGSGVYTVIVWGDAQGEGVALTSYSIFVG